MENDADDADVAAIVQLPLVMLPVGVLELLEPPPHEARNTQLRKQTAITILIFNSHVSIRKADTSHSTGGDKQSSTSKS
jgi:hypothetical protein